MAEDNLSKKLMRKKVQSKKGGKNEMPVAFVSTNDGICMISRTDNKLSSTLKLSQSENGVEFVDYKQKISIKKLSKSETIKNCENFIISSVPSGFLMTYLRKNKDKSKNVLVIAKSKDLCEWAIKSEIPAMDSFRATVSYEKNLDLFYIYRNGLFVKGQLSRTVTVWKEKPELLFTYRFGMFDAESMEILGSIKTPQGILVVYDSSVKSEKNIILQVGGALFDSNNPKRLLWRCEAPLWQGLLELKNKNFKIYPTSFVSFKNIFYIYWVTEDGNIISASFPALFKESEVPEYKILKKFHKNPIIEPRDGHHWESVGTFNPGVFQDDEGMIHVVYRALGSDGISRIGYAKSENGTKIIHRLPYPIFQPSPGYGMPDEKTARGPVGIHPAYYTSGGGWGGAEDPRLVEIDGTVYMTYVAFEGWHSVRIALTSITLEDFKKGKWNWKKPQLISLPGKVSKNWVLFPEKIKGKFAILHSIVPDIMIEYLDSLDNLEKFIESPRPEGPRPGREGFWDDKLRGAGPPPLKTKLGWLLLYHALDRREPNKYKLGAMILDKNDPTKVLYRSEHPILFPDMWYENEGKPGVIYASGAVIRGKELFVYYGGGDRVVCVATTPLDNFLGYLVSGDVRDYKFQNA